MITWEHIDTIERQVRINLDYFASLQEAQLVCKRADSGIWENLLFAKETYDIMPISVHGSLIVVNI